MLHPWELPLLSPNLAGGISAPTRLHPVGRGHMNPMLSELL